MIKNCLNPKCNKEFTPKNKKGVYCSGNCRAAHAYQLKNWKIGIDKFTVELPESFRNATKIGIFKKDGTIEEIKNIDQLPPEWAMQFRSINASLGEVKKFEVAEVTLEIKETPVVPINLNEKRISELRNELKNPPKNPQIGLRKWIAVRENEIKKLEQNLKDN